MAEARKYEKKSEHVEAFLYDGEAHHDLVLWCGGKLVPGKDGTWALELPKNSGAGYACVNEWVVKKSDGKFDILEEAEFATMYTEVSE